MVFRFCFLFLCIHITIFDFRSLHILNYQLGIGAGYVLKMILTPSASQSKILETVQLVVPDASVSQTGLGNSSELSIVIPTSTTSVFPPLLTSLTSRKLELGISSFGLTQTTMDDVFVR